MHSRFLDLSNMAVVSQQRHNHSRTSSTRVSKCNSRRGVLIAGRIQRLETHARNIPANISALGSSRKRPFCLSVNRPTPSLCELEERPRSRSDGCLFSKLGPTQKLCIPAIRTDWALPQTGHPSTSSKSCDSYPGLGNAILVRSAPGAVCGPTTAPPTSPNLLNREQEQHPLQDLVLAAWLVSDDSSRQTAFRTKLEPFSCPLGVNPQLPVTTLLGNRGLAAVYKNKVINPVSASLNAIIEYPTHLFHLGREYRTINLHRSAISKTHPPY